MSGCAVRYKSIDEHSVAKVELSGMYLVRAVETDDVDP